MSEYVAYSWCGDVQGSAIGESARLVDVDAHPVRDVLDILLKDKTTKRNIIWATDAYSSGRAGCCDTDMIIPEVFSTGNPVVLRSRIEKTEDQRNDRTRKKAEVFTPVWLCNRMNNVCDEEWFGRKDVFNTERPDGTWAVVEGEVSFPKGRDWREYVDSRRLEITCGEAPYLVSRYDAATGRFILPPSRRIGVLDRKLRVVGENTDSQREWLKWVVRAFQSCYGYEWQGDNLLIARINLLMTFQDYCWDRWGAEPDGKALRQVANIISWNLWQMDGLKDTIPFGKPYHEQRQMTLFDSFVSPDRSQAGAALPCRIYDWRRDNSLQFKDTKKVGAMGKRLFDFVIGNPPYQDESVGDQKNYGAPIYPMFLDASYEVAEHVLMIHPARFLFDAGGTSKEWNRKMLDDEHLKVLFYEPDSTKVFEDTSIKGGVAVTYRDSRRTIGPVTVFIPFPELASIKKKVTEVSTCSLTECITNRGLYKYSKTAYEELSDKLLTTDARIAPNAFEKMPELFTKEKPDDEREYVQIYGNIGGKREYRWFRRDYIRPVDNLTKYKVMVPKANGSGSLGEVLSTPLIGTPLIGTPLIGFTETYISIGCTDSSAEAESVLKYVKTKFARCMLGILKVTQDNPSEKWEFVPLQDFTGESDIDWSQSIHSIDLQLYRKYGLSAEEVDFIESHVQEMT